jgi:hypothetical protein
MLGSRNASLCRALLAASLLSSLGCGIKEIEHELEVAAQEPPVCDPPTPYPDTVDAEITLRGELNVSVLINVCDDAVCSEQSPLAVGTEHDLELYVDRRESADGSVFTDYGLYSDTPEVLALGDVSSFYGVSGEILDQGVCVAASQVGLRGKLAAVKAGSAKLNLTRYGKVIDTYTIVVGGAGDAPDASVAGADAGMAAADAGMDMLDAGP